MITVRNTVWNEGDLIARWKSIGSKVPRTVISLDNLLPQLTPDELVEFKRRLEIHMLTDPDCDPETRQWVLSTMETCPYCQSWLGHNHPPADDSGQGEDLSWLTSTGEPLSLTRK